MESDARYHPRQDDKQRLFESHIAGECKGQTQPTIPGAGEEVTAEEFTPSEPHMGESPWPRGGIFTRECPAPSMDVWEMLDRRRELLRSQGIDPLADVVPDYYPTPDTSRPPKSHKDKRQRRKKHGKVGR